MFPAEQAARFVRYLEASQGAEVLGKEHESGLTPRNASPDSDNRHQLIADSELAVVKKRLLVQCLWASPFGIRPPVAVREGRQSGVYLIHETEEALLGGRLRDEKQLGGPVRVAWK